MLLAYLEKEEKMTRQVLAGLTENDAQNKKETLEASEAGEAAISRRAARINELTAYLALIERRDMKCSEIIKILETLSPRSMACDWDNPGLLAGAAGRK